MDIIDKVTFDWSWEEEDGFLAEKTRQAFVNIFNRQSEDAELVMRHLVTMCKYDTQIECNDPIIEAKMNSMRGVIFDIKKQINMRPIIEQETQGESNE